MSITPRTDAAITAALNRMNEVWSDKIPAEVILVACDLERENAELLADKARLRVALEKCVDTLNDPRIGTHRYMEGSEIYDDFAVAIATAKTALSS